MIVRPLRASALIALLSLGVAAPLPARGEDASADAWWAHVAALANDGMEGRLT